MRIMVVIYHNSLTRIGKRSLTALESVLETVQIFDKVLLLDNASSDETSRVLRGACRERGNVIHIELRRNLGYASAVELACRSVLQRQGRGIMCIATDDVVIIPENLEMLVKMLEDLENYSAS